jgi:putative nucleotidyltransferase with HDIG domain
MFTRDSLFYGLPIAAGALVISAVLGIRHAAIFAVLISVFSAMIGGYRLEHIVYPLVGSLVGAREALGSRQRSTLFRAGVWVGVVNAILILCFSVKAGMFSDWKPLVGDIVVGLSGGFISGIIATGLVPLVEVLFSYTTDIKLLELSNLNHPLLRDLIVRAPGTYHHAIVTGSLVEAAAEAIDANPLLARVGAYYHDIGKMRKPIYFIENQKGIENKHDKLSPSMSALILISHVKDGVEKAREYKLGNAMKDIIQQHHGTSLISFFFKRAKAVEEASHADYVVDEKDFRYPGPKPQTKEAGLVMLADAVEAASRTLTDPTPARIQGLVKRIITNVFADGQLDETPLTLNDLHLIAKSFNRILTGMFHHRIEYPERHEPTDKKPPTEAAGRRKNGQSDSDRELKRLGIS